MRLAGKRCPLLLLLCVALAADRAVADFANYRSIFVDRFDYTYNSGNIPAMVAAIDNQMQRIADEMVSAGVPVTKKRL